MPKIDVNEEVFYTLAGKRWNIKEEFEEALTCAKAELDGGFGSDGQSLPAAERTMKIELNDTNRPDLWGTAGCARQLRMYNGGKPPVYPFFSSQSDVKAAARKAIVEKSAAAVRPFLTGFVASGKAISDAMLKDIIQTQEKLAWNFGRKRRTISMGIYRTASIKWPVVYKGVDQDSVSFVPLQWDTPLTLRQILKQHPKGKEYAFIQEHESIHPLLTDSSASILSYPPIINSADIGAVQVGDSSLFVELTGTDINAVTLATSIVACDLADNGFTIEPVEIVYEFDTPFGRSCVTPYYFQEPIFCSLSRVEKFLGEKLDGGQCVAALAKMGVRAEKAQAAERGSTQTQDGITAFPPEYRNDFLHAADVAEDVMIGRGLASFKPERPRDFTVGRLTPVTLFSRKVKNLMVGMGYQEMIYNYLGSRKDFVDKMHSDGSGNNDRIIRISNPMTENYEYVRDSVIPSLLMSEAVSGHALFPHKTFEIGKIAFLDTADNYGSLTRQCLGFLHAEKDANFNTAAAQIQTLFYYIAREYQVEESADPRFIPGRAAQVICKGKTIGVFGELHPAVLENWGLTMPCTAAELDIEALV
jgi:phenylalanyl-tRNA synthetase beta chain